MEKVEEKKQAESSMSLKAYLISRLGTCWGYDNQTRLELEIELRELLLDDYDFEVIGNIYENPELLK